MRDTATPRMEDEALRTPIDAYLEEARRRHGLERSPVADDLTFAKRVAHGLLGLPLSKADLQMLEQDPSPNRHQRFIDRTLASPRYGERWGRHWLDVARYSDTKGYTYAGEEPNFVHAWLYRDWVIDAFNADLPYDEFILRQLAADRLLTSGAGAPSDLAAMGFLTLGRRFIGVEQDIIDDRIDVVTRGFLGLTAACARCHDHKYDPIPTADYYALYGVFKSSAKRLVPLAQCRDAELAKRREKLSGEFNRLAEEMAALYLERLEDYLLATLDISQTPKPEFSEILGRDDLIPAQVRRWHEFLSQNSLLEDPVFGPWKALQALPRETFARDAGETLSGLAQANPLVVTALEAAPLSGMEDVASRYAGLLREAAARDEPGPWAQLRAVVDGPPIAIGTGVHVHAVEWLFSTDDKHKLKELQAAVDRQINALGRQSPHAVILEDLPRPQNARILLRGDYASPGDEVPRGFLRAVMGREQHFTEGSGRLQMARLIADASNPLTARVMVNRLWHHHFGAGLVRTTSDFGRRCQPPSHPELLDFLASRLIEHQWSLKWVHRLIASSLLYRQASAAPDQRDPENRFFAHHPRRRLDFEAMRDALLTASGELDLTPGGQPGKLLARRTSLRRSVYGKIDRQFLPKPLQVFDFANPELHSPRRSETMVPQQALFFLNSPFVRLRAKALAQRCQRIAGADTDARIRQLFHLVYQREPTTLEREQSRAFIATALAEDASPQTGPVVNPWRYGYGTWDAAAQHVESFRELPHFTGKEWRGGAKLPNAQLGWLQLTAEGGHPGNTLQHAAVRRWVSPLAGVISIRGAVRLVEGCGDGVRVVVASSRSGLLGQWQVTHERQTPVEIGEVEVQHDEVIDFIVDHGPGGNHLCDGFLWAPILQEHGEETAPGWNAKEQFRGPPEDEAPLTAWQRFAQALLFSNEFTFVD